MALVTPYHGTRPIGETPLKPNACLIPQLSRYSVASVIALAIDLGVYSALCAFSVNAVLAGIIGYAVGMITHYGLSSAFVFDVSRTEKSASRRLAEFAASGVLGLVLTGLIIGAMTKYFVASPIIAKLAAVATSFLAVFFVRRLVVFAPAFEGSFTQNQGLPANVE